MDNDLRIIITRPQPFATQLQQQLQETGFCNVHCLPCIAINPLPAPTLADNTDMIIFTSRNAVIHGHTLHRAGMQVAAIGAGTREQCKQHGIACDIFPKESPFNSERLLELLTDVKGKHIAIITGQDGRPLLADTLQQRGAKISTIAVYERALIDYNEETLRELLQQHNCLVVCSSEVILRAFIELAKKAQIDWQSLQYCVISSTMQQRAKSIGINNLLVAASAQHQDIVWTLNKIGNQ